MPPKRLNYWAGLPMYADMYIRPAYEMIIDIEGLIEFVHYFLMEYMESNNDAKRCAIEAVVFPIYYTLTRRDFDTTLIAL
jgi:hypothetical protein